MNFIKLTIQKKWYLSCGVCFNVKKPHICPLPWSRQSFLEQFNIKIDKKRWFWKGEKYPFLTLIWKDKVHTDDSYKKISTKTEEQSVLRFRCLQNPFSKIFRQNRLYFCWCNFRRVTRGVGVGETSPSKSVFLIFSCAHSAHFHSHHPRPSQNKIQATLLSNFYFCCRELLVTCSRNYYIGFINCLIGGNIEF